MKLPLFVFSLVVLYWAYITCSEENVNSTRDVTSSVENLSEHQGVFWERALSRNKRSVLTSSVSNLLLQGLKKSISFIPKPELQLLKPMLDLGDFIYDVLYGTNVCSKEENVPLSLESIVHKPIETIKTIVCNFFDLIGSENRKAIRILLDKAIKFINKILLPGLYKALNAMKKNLPLPPTIVAMIDIFDAYYNFMEILEYVI